jgi:UrcA family protein
MRVSTASMYPDILRRGLPVALAIGALTVLSARVHAFDLDPITISAPVMKTVGDSSTPGMPVENVTVKATITPDALSLTTDSGVALLKEKVLEAAREACDAADPFTWDDLDCIYEAVKSAKPQVHAAIARARSSSATE